MGVGILMIAVLVPMALIQLAGKQANMTAAGVDSTVIVVLVVLLPVLAIIGLAIYFIPRMRK